MKRSFLTPIIFVFSILILSTLSWGQCPEDPNDSGECDTLNIICLDCEQSPGSGPYFVRFLLLVTHDQIDYNDSIGGFVVPLAWTHTNPSAYCSLGSWWNTTSTLSVYPDFSTRSIFRHTVEGTDTLYHNRMADLAADFMGRDWNTKILILESDSSWVYWSGGNDSAFVPPHSWMSLAASGSEDQWWWEGDRVLLATLTFLVEDTMHVYLDTTFWPPSGRLKFGRYDTETYVPRDNLPNCFWIGPSQIRITSPNGGESWAVGTAQQINWLSENFDGPDVKIEYSTNSGTDWSTVEINAPNTGSYSWSVPATPSEYCRVRVSDAEDEDPYDISDADFSIIQSDFTIAVDPDTQEVQAGSSVNVDVILTSLYGFASPCTLTVSGLPPDASESFDPNPITPTDTSILQINTAETTPADTYTVTVTASEIDKGIVHTDELVLIVTSPPDFTIEADPDTQQVQAGNSVNYDVILTSLYGFASPCTLTVSGLPPDASESFDPNPATPTDTSVMTISTAVTTPPGSYNITVTATEIDNGKIEHSTQVVLIVPEPDFTIEASPETLEVTQGDQGAYEVILTSVYGFNATCSLSVSGLPQNASGQFEPNTLIPTDTSALTITVAETTPIDTYNLTITGTELIPPKGEVEHSVDVVLVILSPQDFAIGVFPDSLRLSRDRDSSYTVTLTAISGFNSPCTLTVTGLPEGAEGTFESPVLVPTDSTALNIHLSDTTPPSMDTGSYTLTVTATEMVGGKALQRSEDVTLIVTLPTWAFYIEAYPDTQRVEAGNDTTFGVIMVPNTGFAAPCTLSIESGLPPDASFSFDPEMIFPNDTSILTIFTAVTTPAEIYQLTIKGTANPKQESTTSVFLRVDEQSYVEDWTDNPNAPKSFALFQNQPNPFNPETKISYYLPTACQVKLIIYNVLGQRVKTVFDGHQDAGMKTLIWDGRDDYDDQLGSGIYFYRLQADNFHQTKKMILMK
ncbi:MAG: hypothetical protein AMJ91_04635 [candidate division Zixibacteria bacterium SM23_73_3]|nr:MAG: hypothetical protein AMJ91_04635 [candidate division Zixibacteria bacterium SM23_73_3]